MSSLIISLVVVLYAALLFLIAYIGDRYGIIQRSPFLRPFIYALSLAVYCTSWTFFGSVGLSAIRGLEFIAIYTGPILVFTLGLPLIRRIVHLGKSENLTSMADLLAARYGKNMRIAWLATIIATIGTIPYIALQLKAVISSMELLFFGLPSETIGLNSAVLTEPLQTVQNGGASQTVSFLIALSLAIFAVIFGTRHADATEHQEGLVLAIAVESAVKLVAFLSVGIVVTFVFFDGPVDLFTQAQTSEKAQAALLYDTSMATWIVLTLLSACAAIMLPRQFHMAIVENRNAEDLKTASWAFPSYLILINLFVLPIALAGVLTFGPNVSADLYVLALPMSQGFNWLSLFVFVGGLSAATAMVVVACVALSIMVSNDIVIPIILRRATQFEGRYQGDWANMILNVRRTLIFGIMTAAFAYYLVADQNTQLATIGLLAFAAIAQLAPALIFGLYWRRANARGALIGLSVGILVWAYTLMAPTLASEGAAWVNIGPFGLSFLKPQALFGFELESLNHGVAWSLLLNSVGLIIGSLSRKSTPIERVQATTFAMAHGLANRKPPSLDQPILNSELLNTVSLYLGAKRSRRAFEQYHANNGLVYAGDRLADGPTIKFAEQILSGAVGSATARLIMTLLLEKKGTNSPSTYKLLDDASTAIQQNRDLLQVALDQIVQGIIVLDDSYRLRCWNQQYREIFELSEQFGQVGLSIFDLHEGICESQNIEGLGREDLLKALTNPIGGHRLRLHKRDKYIEINTSEMPEGGLAMTFTDITSGVESDAALKAANEELEHRVALRTQELSSLALALEDARNQAEVANSNKTKFLAATGHDILQPLNAARLYCSTGLDQEMEGPQRTTLEKVDSALDAVEDIITTVLDISRLDTDRIRVNPRDVSLDETISQVIDASRSISESRGIDLRYVKTSLWVHCDRSLLRRLIQNLVSNALNYTEVGKVIIGVKRCGDKHLKIVVADTGIGIGQADQENIFNEFSRLNKSPSKVGGLGLGLSIVKRVAKLIDSNIDIYSKEHKGSIFTVKMKRLTELKKPQAIRKTSNQKSFGLDGLKVLNVDNDPAILDGIKQLLSNWGCEVVSLSGSEELARMGDPMSFTPDVLIVDYQLDNENGFEVANLIHGLFGADLPTYMATADRSQYVLETAAEHDISIIHKPLKPAALRAVLSKHRAITK